MTPVEFIEFARKKGYRFIFLDDTRLLVSKTGEHPLNERRGHGFFAGCTLDLLMCWHLMTHALTLRLSVEWEGEQ